MHDIFLKIYKKLEKFRILTKKAQVFNTIHYGYLQNFYNYKKI